MLSGLSETEAALRAKAVPFFLLRGAEPGEAVAAFATGGEAPQPSSSAAPATASSEVDDKLRTKVETALEVKGVVSARHDCHAS